MNNLNNPKLTPDLRLALEDTLENAIALRESGEGGGHGAQIQLLNKLGQYPLSSRDAERAAQKLLDEK